MNYRSSLIVLAALSVLSGCAETPDSKLRKLIDARVAAARADGMEYLGRPTIQVHCHRTGPDSAVVILEDSGKGDLAGPFAGWRTFELLYVFKNGQWRFTAGRVRGNYDEVLSEPLPRELEKYFADCRPFGVR